MRLPHCRSVLRACQRQRPSQRTRASRWQRGAHPWENGYVESFNGKLRDELLNLDIFDTLLEAQVLVERWRRHYNVVRPHSSLGYRPPAPETVLPWAESMALSHQMLPVRVTLGLDSFSGARSQVKRPGRQLRDIRHEQRRCGPD